MLTGHIGIAKTIKNETSEKDNKEIKCHITINFGNLVLLVGKPFTSIPSKCIKIYKKNTKLEISSK